jgi:hypothetical protein
LAPTAAASAAPVRDVAVGPAYLVMLAAAFVFGFTIVSVWFHG